MAGRYGAADVRRRFEGQVLMDDDPAPTVAIGTASDAQLRFMVDGTTDYAMFMLSPEGLVLTWNMACALMKGYTAAEVIGRHFSVFYTAEAVAAGHPQHELEVATAQGQYTEVGWRARKDGAQFWASVTITALRDQAGDLQGFSKITRDLTELREAGEVAQRLRSNQQQVFETLAEGVLLYSVSLERITTLQLATTAACELLGADEGTLRSMSLGDAVRGAIYDADGQPLTVDQLPAAVTARTGCSVHNFIWGWSYQGQEVRWISSNSRAMVDQAGVTTGVVFTIVDVTEGYVAQRALSAAHARFSALVENSSDVICILDGDGRVSYASPAYLGVYGEKPADRVGLFMADRIHPEDRSRFAEVLAKLAAHPERVVSASFRVVHADGRTRQLEVTAANYLGNLAVGGFVTNSRDVTDQAETTTRLAHQALHDSLTGLANQALLLDRVTQALGRARRSNGLCALLYLDLDNFRRVNDSLGHVVGDHVLVTVTNRLKQILSPADTIARLGGGEFVILTEELVDTQSASLLAERARQAVNEPVDFDGRAISVDCSVGITFSDGSGPEVLLQQADSALYRAKAGGGGRWELYDQATRLGAQRQMATETLLRRAIVSAGIVAHYQPIISLESGLWVGSEALARLVDDSQASLVQPNDFIAIAEDTGLIVALGLEMLQLACQQQARWANAVNAPTSVSVNLSPRQLRSPGLADVVRAILSASGLKGPSLCLELTESSLMEADNSTRRVMRDLSDMGIAIALDDFGTGMSSLAHLRQFTVHILKIDCSFVAGLGANQDDTEVVKSIVSLGRALGLGVIAEGVETALQARVLKDLGCPEAQGYFYGRPGPADQVQQAALDDESDG